MLKSSSPQGVNASPPVVAQCGLVNYRRRSQRARAGEVHLGDQGADFPGTDDAVVSDRGWAGKITRKSPDGPVPPCAYAHATYPLRFTDEA